MFKPLVDDGSHHDRERKTRFMLTSSGRVVRIYGDPSAGSHLMVPTEHELKMILYDQTDAGTRTHERGKIDFVTLHANRGPRQKGSKHARKNQNRTDRGGDENHRPCVRREKRGNKLCLRVRQRDSSPRDGTVEEEEVSTFLDSFQSTCDMAERNPALALQTAVSPSAFPTSLCQGATSGRHTNQPEYIVHHNTRDTLEMTKPLAQIDLYNILASAAPAEPVDAASRRPRGDICNNGCPTAGSKKESNRTTREKSSTRSVRSVDARGKRRASRAVTMTSGDEIGGCLTRDSLGDEVAILQAKAEESIRRIKRDVEKEKPATSIDIARCYGTLLAERPRRLNDPLHLVKYVADGNDGTKKCATNDASAILPFAAAMVKDGDMRADAVAQGSRHLGCGRRNVAEERRRKARNKSTHSTGRNTKRMSSTCGSGGGTGICPGEVKRSLIDGDQEGLPAKSPIKDYLGNTNTKLQEVHHQKNTADGKDSTSDLKTGGLEREAIPDVAAVEINPVFSDSRMVEAIELDDETGVIVHHHHVSVLSGKRCESLEETLARAAVKDIGGDFAEGGGALSQQSLDGDDGLKSTRSDYGEESFESTDETLDSGVESSAVVARCTVPEDLVTRTCVRVNKNAMINRYDDADENGAGASAGRRYEPVCSRSKAMTEENKSRERAAAEAAALEIEACWRGFLGRRAAKWALRCALLDVLRRLGGGKMSKVASLADVERKDRRELNRALRVATQPRHHLPPKEHISACVRFVESFHRRRARFVEARKRRWLEERGRRRANQKKYAMKTPSLLLSSSARVKSIAAC